MTSRIRVASRVLGVPYRSPAMVAKMASLDRLSAGRLILGLGGGYSDQEFRASGLPDPTAREKVDGLAEAIQIAHGLWSEPAFTLDGRHHRTVAAPLEPKPAHHIPIWLGTFGPRALIVTGRLADGWIPSLGNAPPEQIPAMRDRIRRSAEDAGRDPGAVSCVYNLRIRIGAAADDAAIVSGSVDAVIERLLGFVELGFTGFNFCPDGPGPDEQIERLATDVIPLLRSAA